MIDISILIPYNTPVMSLHAVWACCGFDLSMLTVRSFRNADPPRLLALWRKTQRCQYEYQEDYASTFPLSLNQLQTQILGLPMLNAASVMLAFEEETLVGYIHTIFAPSLDGYTFDYTVGQICFLCIDPDCSDALGAASALIHAGENYLASRGAQKIFGGSPSPSAPFYTGFYGGGEAVGILHSNKAVIDAFQAANYQIHQQTRWFYYNIQHSLTDFSAEMASHYEFYSMKIGEVQKARTWWEGCSLANGMWYDAMAYSIQEKRPVARLRVRVTCPDASPEMEDVSALYGRTWLASLVELRVHPDFPSERMQDILLDELIRYLIAHNQVFRIEAHAAEGSLLFILLRRKSWKERGNGSVFVKVL